MGGQLEGKVAVVTGAGQGIGRGVALRLAREGADIVVAEINAETAKAVAAEVEGLGRCALACELDISRVASVQTMVDRAMARFEHVDILINNAGIHQTKPMMELSEADWDRVMNVNFRGLFFCLQVVARQMIRQAPKESEGPQGPIDIGRLIAAEEGSVPPRNGSHGKIVNLSSVAGRFGRPLQTHYAASKAGVISITQSAALALAPYQINVNAVAPGIVATPMWEAIDRDRAKLFGLKPGEAMASYIKQVPLGRVSLPADVASVIGFLCSSAADFVTGQTVNVDGGFLMT
jgi:NAD(P)-dependent dehydrogenase (short-subunit alcohol dehydrogenase family)